MTIGNTREREAKWMTSTTFHGAEAPTGMGDISLVPTPQELAEREELAEANKGKIKNRYRLI